jgi:exodeoxyribonuclease VII small subunit
MPAKKNVHAAKNYQELSGELDGVIAKLEDPETGIDELVELYEQALELSKELENHLEKAENRIVEIKAKFNKGD